MFTRFSPALLLPGALMLIAVCEAQESKTKADLDELQGTWVTVSLMNDGKTLVDEANQPADLLAAKLVFEGRQWMIKVGDDNVGGGKFKIDARKNPKQIDILDESGQQNENTKLGIYRIDGDTYTFCLAPAGSPRPNEFSSPAGSGHSLGVSKREKQD